MCQVKYFKYCLTDLPGSILFSCSWLEQLLQKVEKAVKKWHFIPPTARGAYPAPWSIPLNIFNSIINAASCRETRVKWAVPGVIDPEREIKPFLALCLER